MQAQEPENFTQICLKIITGGTKLILYVYLFFFKDVLYLHVEESHSL